MRGGPNPLSEGPDADRDAPWRGRGGDPARSWRAIEEMGYQARPMPGKQRTTVGLVGNDGRVDASRLAALPGVQEIIHVTKPYKQVSREWQPESTMVRLPGGLTIGGDEVVVMAGPCSVESERQILAGRPRGSGRRRHGAPSRRVQAAELAVRLPGAGPCRARAAGPGPRRDRSPHRHRGDGCRRPGSGGRGGRHRPDRRPQHAELLAAQARRPLPASRCCSSVVCPPPSRSCCSRPSICWPRAIRHVILCERGIRGFDHGDAEPLRPERDPRGPWAVPPAYHRRPEPRHRPPGHGHPDGARRGRGRRGRAPDRGASASRTARCPTARRASTPSSSIA